MGGVILARKNLARNFWVEAMNIVCMLYIAMLLPIT